MRRNAMPPLFLQSLKITAFTLATFALAACGGYSTEKPQSSKDTNSPNGLDAALVASGKALYEVRCDNCHGIDGRGTAQASSLVTAWDEDELVILIEDHDPPLPSPCTDDCATETALYVIPVKAGT